MCQDWIFLDSLMRSVHYSNNICIPEWHHYTNYELHLWSKQTILKTEKDFNDSENCDLILPWNKYVSKIYLTVNDTINDTTWEKVT